MAGKKEGTGKVYAPCGLIANSMFNGNLCYKVQTVIAELYARLYYSFILSHFQSPLSDFDWHLSNLHLAAYKIFLTVNSELAEAILSSYISCSVQRVQSSVYCTCIHSATGIDTCFYRNG